MALSFTTDTVKIYVDQRDVKGEISIYSTCICTHCKIDEKGICVLPNVHLKLGNEVPMAFFF